MKWPANGWQCPQKVINNHLLCLTSRSFWRNIYSRNLDVAAENQLILRVCRTRNLWRLPSSVLWQLAKKIPSLCTGPGSHQKELDEIFTCTGSEAMIFIFLRNKATLIFVMCIIFEVLCEFFSVGVMDCISKFFWVMLVFYAVLRLFSQGGAGNNGNC